MPTCRMVSLCCSNSSSSCTPTSFASHVPPRTNCVPCLRQQLLRSHPFLKVPITSEVIPCTHGLFSVFQPCLVLRTVHQATRLGSLIVGALRNVPPDDAFFVGYCICQCHNQQLRGAFLWHCCGATSDCVRFVLSAHVMGRELMFALSLSQMLVWTLRTDTHLSSPGTKPQSDFFLTCVCISA